LCQLCHQTSTDYGMSSRRPPSPLIELVAGQADWKKRTRELRYLGWEIEATKRKLESGKSESYYTLHKFTVWPDDPIGWIRDFERDRAIENAGGEP
jgi:hypothetical protein